MVVVKKEKKPARRLYNSSCKNDDSERNGKILKLIVNSKDSVMCDEDKAVKEDL